MPSQPAPMHTPELRIGPLNLIDTQRSLIHIETGEGHPDGEGIRICSLNKKFTNYAELFYKAPEVLAERDDLKWQIAQAIATAKLRGLQMDENALPWWQQFAPSPGEAALLAALQGLLDAQSQADKQWLGLNMNNPGEKLAYEIVQAARIKAERALSAAQANEREGL